MDNPGLSTQKKTKKNTITINICFFLHDLNWANKKTTYEEEDKGSGREEVGYVTEVHLDWGMRRYQGWTQTLGKERVKERDELDDDEDMDRERSLISRTNIRR